MEEIYYKMGPRNRPHEFCSFAVADVRNRDRLAWFGGSCSYIISFRLDAALRRSKTICLRLGETASINSKLCIIKRYALFDWSDHLFMYRTPNSFL